MPQPADGQLVGRDVGEADPSQSFIVAGERLCPSCAPRRGGVGCAGIFCGVRVLLHRPDAADLLPRQQSGQWAFVPAVHGWRLV